MEAVIIETKRSDATQLTLWAVKEAAWRLYEEAFWKPGVPQLVRSIESLVNTAMRELGYDPTYIIK